MKRKQKLCANATCNMNLLFLLQFLQESGLVKMYFIKNEPHEQLPESVVDDLQPRYDPEYHPGPCVQQLYHCIIEFRIWSKDAPDPYSALQKL